MVDQECLPFLCTSGYQGNLRLYQIDNRRKGFAVVGDHDLCDGPLRPCLKSWVCYCYYYFPSLFHFVYNFCYFRSGHFIICYCLLIHVYNLESEYSTPQLLTSDSRYSYSFMSQYTQLLTSDSSCLIPCSIRSQSHSSVSQRLSHVPRNILHMRTYSTALILLDMNISSTPPNSEM